MQQEPRALARAGDGEHDAGAEDARRQQHDDRPEQAQQQRGRSLAPVRRAPGVVADEPVDHRPGLERDRAEQQHAEEEVQGEQAADPQDREALDGQQDQQHRPGHRGQPLVALGPAELPGTPSRLGLPRPLGRLGRLALATGGRPGNPASSPGPRTGLDMTRPEANRRCYAPLQVSVSISYETRRRRSPQSAAVSRPARCDRDSYVAQKRVGAVAEDQRRP